MLMSDLFPQWVGLADPSEGPPATARWRQPPSVSWRALNASLSSDLDQNSCTYARVNEIQAVLTILCRAFLTVDAKVYVNGTDVDVVCNGRGIVATRIQYKQYNHY